MPLKFVTVNDNVFQLLGPTTGAPPLDPAMGDFRPPDPLGCAVLKFPVKIPCAGVVYPHFSGRLEIIPPFVSGRLLWDRCAFGQLIVREFIKNCCVQMRFLGAKYAKIRLLRTPLGSLRRSHRPLSWS